MLQICLIGAGFSGICAGIKIQTELQNICNLTILEQNYDFGGVWLNNYPGCAVEVPSHLYCFSFEPKADWTQAYCEQEEILSYLQFLAKKYDLYSKAKFGHSVRKLTWNEISQKWIVSVSSHKTGDQNLEFDIIIDAHGRFSSPEIPQNFKKFLGPVVHSSKFSHDVDLTGNILIVGCGASGAQIIPHHSLTNANHLIVYQRHAPWVMPKTNFFYHGIVKWTFANFPLVQRFYRKCLFLLFERNISGFRVGSVANKLAPLLSKFHLWRQIKSQSIRRQLTPNYNFGCKRIVNSNEYYLAFNRPNVTLISEPITVLNDSIKLENGTSYKVDVIVLATGFQVQNFFGEMQITGKNKKNIPEMWIKDKPKTYLSICNSALPNFFILLGPNSSTGYTSIILQLETQVEWIIKALKELVSRKSRTISVKISAEERYMQEIEKKAKKTVFGSSQCASCNSWYLNSKGDVVEIFPDSTYAYKKLTEKLILSDLEFD